MTSERTYPWQAFRWDGAAMLALNPTAAAKFAPGAIYRLQEVSERSLKTHNHYFAAIEEAWMNLPHILMERFATPEHLRKFVLIRTRYRNERTIIVETPAEAERLSILAHTMDDYAMIVVRDLVVTIYTAKSQNMQEMDRATFQGSKTAVLDYLAAMLSIPVEDLKRNAGRAA